jgi:hypothetical protein
LGEEGVRVISPFREISSEQPKPHRKKHLGTVRIRRDDKPLLDSLFERLGLDTTLNQSEKMAQLLLWVDDKLADSPQPLQGELDLSPIPSEDQAIAKGAAVPIAADTSTRIDSPDPQEAAPKATAPTAQVFLQPDDEPDPEPPDKISSPPVEEAPTPSGLEEKLEKLIDVMAQFLSLQMAQATAPKPSPPKKSPPPTDASPSKAAIKEAAISDKQEAVSESAPTAIANDDKPSRSPRHSPEAEAAINSAINALIAHNNKTELHDLKWFISINSVKELVSHLTKSQRLVQKVMVSRQQEIDSHHSQHQLEPNHNHRHKQKRRVGDVIFL